MPDTLTRRQFLERFNDEELDQAFQLYSAAEQLAFAQEAERQSLIELKQELDRHPVPPEAEFVRSAEFRKGLLAIQGGQRSVMRFLDRPGNKDLFDNIAKAANLGLVHPWYGTQVQKFNEGKNLSPRVWEISGDNVRFVRPWESGQAQAVSEAAESGAALEDQIAEASVEPRSPGYLPYAGVLPGGRRIEFEGGPQAPPKKSPKIFVSDEVIKKLSVDVVDEMRRQGKMVDASDGKLYQTGELIVADFLRQIASVDQRAAKLMVNENFAGRALEAAGLGLTEASRNVLAQLDEAFFNQSQPPPDQAFTTSIIDGQEVIVPIEFESLPKPEEIRPDRPVADETAAGAIAVGGAERGKSAEAKPPPVLSDPDRVLGIPPGQAPPEPQVADVTRVAPREITVQPTTFGKTVEFLFQSPTSIFGEAPFLPNFVRQGLNESLLGLTAELSGERTLFDLPKDYTPNRFESIGATVVSFMSPTDLATMALGGVGPGLVVRAGARKALKSLIRRDAPRKFIEETLESSARSAGALGTLEAAREIGRGAVAGDVDIKKALETGIHSFKVGAILGAVGRIVAPLGKVKGFPVEVAAGATGIAALEGRAPTFNDVFDFAGIVLGLKLSHGAIRIATGPGAKETVTNEQMELARRIVEESKKGKNLRQIADELVREDIDIGKDVEPIYQRTLETIPETMEEFVKGREKRQRVKPEEKPEEKPEAKEPAKPAAKAKPKATEKPPGKPSVGVEPEKVVRVGEGAAATVAPKRPSRLGEVVEFPVKDIRTDVKTFQNRLTDFSEETAKSVAESFEEARFEPITLFRDPETGDVSVVAGFSRLEGMKRRGEETIPAKFFKGAKEEAEVFARLKSNRGVAAETIAEDVRALKFARERGVSKSEIKDIFKERLPTLEDISSLDEGGKFMEILSQPASAEFPFIKRLSRWVGQLRKEFPDKLTNRHENQLFDFFYNDPTAKKNYTIEKDQFFNLVEGQATRFDFGRDDPLILRKGDIPNVGTRARADTGAIERDIDELKRRRDQAKTIQEREALQKEIDKKRAGIADIVERQTDLLSSITDVRQPVPESDVVPANSSLEVIKRQSEQTAKEEGEIAERGGGFGFFKIFPLRKRAEPFKGGKDARSLRETETQKPSFKGAKYNADQVYGPRGLMRQFWERTGRVPMRPTIQAFKERLRTFLVPAQKLRGSDLVTTFKAKGKSRNPIVKSRDQTFADAVNLLRLMKDAPANGSLMALEALKNITSGLDRSQYAVFGNKLFLDSFKEMQRVNRGLPGDLDINVINSEVARNDQLVRQDPAIVDALRKHSELRDAVTRDLVDRGKLDEGFLFQNYMSHQVMDYIQSAGGLGVKKVKAPFRTYTLFREGSEKDILTDYATAQYRFLSKVFRDNMVEDIINDIGKKFHVPKIKNEVTGKLEPLPGYVDYIVQGNQALQAKSISLADRIFSDVFESMLEPLAKITNKDPQSFAAEVRQEMQAIAFQNAPVRKFHIPEELAETLNEAYGTLWEPSTRISEAITTKWKQFVLNKNPVRYNRRNFVGDFERTFMAARDAFRNGGIARARRVMKDIKNAYQGKLSADYRLAIENSVVGSGEIVQELSSLKELPRFTNISESRLGEWRRPIKALGDNLRDFSEARENFLRLMVFYANMENLRAGRPMFTGISSRETLKGMGDPIERAGKIARETLGDYGNLTAQEQTVRRGAIPFYSWAKINSTFWPLLAKRQGFQTAAGALTVKGAAKTARLAFKVGLGYTLVELWNTSVQDEQEKELPKFVREKFHINTGLKNQDGEWITITDPTALADFFETVGLEGIATDGRQLLKGQTTLQDLSEKRFEKMLEAPVKTFVNRFTPFIKAPGEALFKERTFPNPLDPRPTSDSRLQILLSGIVGREFTDVEMLKQTAARDYYGIGLLGARTFDPNESALRDVTNLVRDFKRKQGFTQEVAGQGPKTETHRDFFRAIAKGDTEKEQELLAKTTFEDFRRYVAGRNPLTRIPRDIRLKFFGKFEDEDREVRDFETGSKEFHEAVAPVGSENSVRFDKAIDYLQSILRRAHFLYTEKLREAENAEQ